MRPKLLFCCLFLSLLLVGQATVSGQKRSGSLSFSVMDGRQVTSRPLGDGLVLRAVRERSADHEHFGWRLEVVRRPYRRTSRNLLYQNTASHGADQSQLYAWHLAEQHFPDERLLPVRGYPYTVRVVLADCMVEGRGADARFTAGEVRISWERR